MTIDEEKHRSNRGVMNKQDELVGGEHAHIQDLGGRDKSGKVRLALLPSSR